MSFVILILVGILLTVTLTFVEFNVYMPSPPTLTVIIALPSAWAVILPSLSTVTTDVSLLVYVTFKPVGTVLATILNVSSTFKSKVLLFTLTLASLKLTITVNVLFSAAAYL